MIPVTQLIRTCRPTPAPVPPTTAVDDLAEHLEALRCDLSLAADARGYARLHLDLLMIDLARCAGPRYAPPSDPVEFLGYWHEYDLYLEIGPDPTMLAAKREHGEECRGSLRSGLPPLEEAERRARLLDLI